MFSAPQITVYAKDIRRSMEFYLGLGFTEAFRYAPHGEQVHVELVLDGFRLGIADIVAARADHGLDPNLAGQAVEVVLWCTDTDTDAAFAKLTGAGAPALSAPHDWLDDLRLAWVAGPDGNPVQLAGRR
ncbi:MAG TPA: VOC family protein [Actinophytocola sp.]|nr:VOC family protein [Actinophytocola sp.]